PIPHPHPRSLCEHAAGILLSPLPLPTLRPISLTTSGGHRAHIAPHTRGRGSPPDPTRQPIPHSPPEGAFHEPRTSSHHRCGSGRTDPGPPPAPAGHRIRRV